MGRTNTFLKAVGVAGIGLCVVLLVLVAARVITWNLFWLVMIIVGGFAYFILPAMKNE